MVLVSQGRSRERVLLFGLEGVGKSLAALDVASRVKPNKLFVIDNDNAWDRMLEGQTLAGDDVQVTAEYRWNPKQSRSGGKDVGGWEFDDRWCVEGGNVVVYHVEGWEANRAAIASVVEEAGPDDWCCIDSGTALWSDVQAWFTEQVFGTTMDDYFMQVRLEKQAAAENAKALGALDGWVDWPVINAQYNGGVMKFLVTPPCHLLVTAEQADIDMKEEKDKEVRGLYGSLFVKPRGQKRIGHNMQTVLLLTKRGDEHLVKTVKDRGGREKVTNHAITDVGFGTWYLEEIAGWQERDDEPTLATTPVLAIAEVPDIPVPVAKKVTKKIAKKKGVVA